MRDMIADKMELEERGWKVAFFLLPVIGLALVILGGRSWNKAQALESWPVVPGTVTASSVEKVVDGSKTWYEARISFRYSVDKFEVVSDHLWLNPKDGWTANEAEAKTTSFNLAVGHPVMVHYDPKKPDEGVINITTRDNYTLPLGLGSLLIIFFLLTEVHHHITKDPVDQALHLDDDPAVAAPKPAQ
jgi:hypothetical protein